MVQSQKEYNKDVIFKEDKLWNWDKQIDVVVLHDLEWGEDDKVESKTEGGSDQGGSNTEYTSSAKVEEGQEGSLISIERRHRSIGCKIMKLEKACQMKGMQHIFYCLLLLLLIQFILEMLSSMTSGEGSWMLK